MIDRLFVYGTLAPGRPNAHVLEGVSGSWQKPSVRGRLLQEGWGAAHGYPGIVLEQDGTRVEGWVFSSEALKDEWLRLDDFEGAQYQRVATQALLDDGQVVQVFIYALAD